MRVLIVKLSSLGDVAHAMPVVHDIRGAHPGAAIDWVVEPAFAPVLRQVDGLRDVIELPLRRWRREHDGAAWRECRAFCRGLRRREYDAVLDLQGLTKSAVVARIARGRRFGLAHRTEGSSFEAPARWLVDEAIHVEPRIHALDRSRTLAARALGHAVTTRPVHGLRALRLTQDPVVLLAHGASRPDKLWPEADWIALGRRLVEAGDRVALPRAGAEEAMRSARIARALGPRAEVWPEMDLGTLVDRMAGTRGVVGVDSGISHLAVALGLPHVQIYRHPTAWRTGPLPAHGHAHQRAIEPRDAGHAWRAWNEVVEAAAECPA